MSKELSTMQLTYSPIDNAVYVERALASSQQITAALALATTAQQQWRQTTIAQRQAICHQMVDAFMANQAEISEQLCWMIGRPIRYATGEVAGLVERARYMIDAAESALKTIELTELPNVTRYIKRQPVGVVLVVAPWNYPYLTAINSIIPAIMAGNAVILKHSAQTPLCAEQLYGAFRQAKLPAGVFQYLHLSHSATESMIKDRQINHVAFTGSVTGGVAIEQAASGRFIGVGLELGGKDAAYVRSDADIERAVDSIVDGGFFNSGQSCCGIERVYVHADVYQQFVTQAVALIKQYRLGRPDDPNTTLGPMVKAAAADFVRGQISEAVDAGAIAHIDPQHFPLDQVGSAYLAPQLLTNVNHSMRVMKQESFGPVVGVMMVHSDEQAIGFINDSEFGLTASIFTRDMAAAVVIGEQLEVGTLLVNRCDYLDPALAWTGVKNSGRGCTLSSLGYQSLTRAKSFYLKVQD